MGSACSSDSGSFESSSGSSSDSSDNSSEDDGSSEDRSSRESLEIGNLSASQKLRNRTRSIISGVKIRSPKEEPLEIVQTTNRDGVSLIRKLRLIRRLGPLSKAVNAAEESRKIQIPEIRVTKAPNSFLRRAKMVKLGSLTKSPKAEEKSPKTEKKSSNAFLRRAKFLGSISRSPKSEKDEESIEEEKKSPRAGGFLKKAKGLARLSSLSKSPPSESKSPPPQVSGKSFFSRKARLLASLGSSPKMTKSEDHEASVTRASSTSKARSIIKRRRMLGKLFQVKSEDHPAAEEVEDATDQALSATMMSSLASSRDGSSASESMRTSRWGSAKSSRFSFSLFSKSKNSSRSSEKRRNSGSSKMSEEVSQAPEMLENAAPAEEIAERKVETEEQPTKSSESTEKDPAQQETPQIQIQAEQDQANLKENSPEAKQEEEEEELVESKNIGSVNTRLSRYQSRANQSPEVRKEPVPKVSTIDKFKDNYLKQTEKAGSTVQAEMATSGALSLKDRMKMFENQSSRSVQREVVGQAERAGDIRSKISNWGVSDSTNSYSQRERITVAPLSDRRSQYTAVANAN